MPKFSAGDIVVVTGNVRGGSLNRRYGVVTDTSNNPCVFFPGFNDGHSGNSNTSSRSFYTVPEDNLTLFHSVFKPGVRVLCVYPPDGYEILVGRLGKIVSVDAPPDLKGRTVEEMMKALDDEIPIKVRFEGGFKWWCEPQSLKVVSDGQFGYVVCHLEDESDFVANPTIHESYDAALKAASENSEALANCRFVARLTPVACVTVETYHKVERF